MTKKAYYYYCYYYCFQRRYHARRYQVPSILLRRKGTRTLNLITNLLLVTESAIAIDLYAYLFNHLYLTSDLGL